MWFLILLLGESLVDAPIDPFVQLRIEAKAYLMGDSVRVVALVSNLGADTLRASYKLQCSMIRLGTRSDSGDELLTLAPWPPYRVWAEPLVVLRKGGLDSASADTVRLPAASEWPAPVLSGNEEPQRRTELPFSFTEFRPNEVWTDSISVPFEDEFTLTRVESATITLRIRIRAVGSDPEQVDTVLGAKPVVVTPLSPNSPLQPTPAGGVD